MTVALTAVKIRDEIGMYWNKPSSMSTENT